MDRQAVRAYLVSYGIQIRQKRIDMGYTQQQVAKLIGCSQAIISHIECGYMLPTPEIEKSLFCLYKMIQQLEGR